MNINKIQCINGFRAFVAAMLLATVWVVPAVAASDKAPEGKDAGKRLEEVKRALGEGRDLRAHEVGRGRRDVAHPLRVLRCQCSDYRHAIATQR